LVLSIVDSGVGSLRPLQHLELMIVLN
jgi:hypothetical protein